jgi:hypothetical protein
MRYPVTVSPISYPLSFISYLKEWLHFSQIAQFVSLAETAGLICCLLCKLFAFSRPYGDFAVANRTGFCYNKGKFGKQFSESF